MVNWQRVKWGETMIVSIVETTSLADLHQLLGASYWAMIETEGTNAWSYHRKQVDILLELIGEARPILFAQPVDRRAFRTLLVKYFEGVLLTEVPYIAKLRYPSDWLDKQLCKDAVEKWVNGDYDKE